MGILSDKLLWSAGPTTTGSNRGFGGFSPAGLNRPSAQTSTGKIANSGALLDSGLAQFGAALGGAAVPGLGMGAKAIDAAQSLSRENAQRELMGTTFGKDLDLEPMGFFEAVARTFSPFHDVSVTKEAFDKQMAARQKSAAINAEAVAGASGASGRDGLRGSPQVADLTSTTKSRKQAFMGRPEALSSASFNFGGAPVGLSRQGKGGGYSGRSGSGVGGGSGATGGGFGGRPGRSGSNLGGPDRPGPAGSF
jgi:hypothetical protein